MSVQQSNGHHFIELIFGTNNKKEAAKQLPDNHDLLSMMAMDYTLSVTLREQARRTLDELACG